MEKNNWNTSLGMELIGAYDSVRKLKPQEFSYLYFYLAYPEKFWKIANHYSQSHQSLAFRQKHRKTQQGDHTGGGEGAFFADACRESGK